ncbi:haloacid dehalogenase, type II [Cladophialophora bantiana CBS 173.52]|uniref:Haloacid dehalogenase, type II n=1 Tax=Cladophialophora bantiana (strain ATCC 10958 / CBS 173.52 / CDC B-1940 / NIH 8579) TaxID=1442370 RepID=A0A0D2FR58_CLAB1|nr:haloacid dehalogenase, type II [Cladophialophora bantiana CBS 173.52]KIW89062.1 haloacid dehalogenase, type II [Cladophialophora bantiana CBS 173.52]
MGKIVVAFDLYGTLLSTESIAKELASHFGQEKAASIAAVWRKYQLEYTWRLNSMKQYQDFSDVTRKSLLHALAEHGVSLSDAQVDKLMDAYDFLSTFPDVNPALKRLENNTNVECVVFSNGTKTMVSNSVNKSNDLNSSVFKDLVTVDVVGVFKPAPEVYKFLAQKVNKVDHEDKMWLVSGNPFDVVGARSIGMQAAWVDRSGNGWQDQLGLGPTVVVRSLEEVADVVEQHAAGSK